MTIVTDNVGNQMYIISCMSVPAIVTCSKEQEPFYDVHERLDDVEVEQAVLIISFLIRATEKHCMLTLARYPSKVLIGVWHVLTLSDSS